jgi:hypothetical protein
MPGSTFTSPPFYGALGGPGFSYPRPTGWNALGEGLTQGLQTYLSLKNQQYDRGQQQQQRDLEFANAGVLQRGATLRYHGGGAQQQAPNPDAAVGGDISALPAMGQQPQGTFGNMTESMPGRAAFSNTIPQGTVGGQAGNTVPASMGSNTPALLALRAGAGSPPLPQAQKQPDTPITNQKATFGSMEDFDYPDTLNPDGTVVSGALSKARLAMQQRLLQNQYGMMMQGMKGDQGQARVETQVAGRLANTDEHGNVAAGLIPPQTASKEAVKAAPGWVNPIQNKRLDQSISQFGDRQLQSQAGAFQKTNQPLIQAIQPYVTAKNALAQAKAGNPAAYESALLSIAANLDPKAQLRFGTMKWLANVDPSLPGKLNIAVQRMQNGTLPPGELDNIQNAISGQHDALKNEYTRRYNAATKIRPGLDFYIKSTGIDPESLYGGDTQPASNGNAAPVSAQQLQAEAQAAIAKGADAGKVQARLAQALAKLQPSK